MTRSALATAAIRALTPADRPLAVFPAMRTVVAVGVCAALGLVFADATALGMMYFGAACAAVFVTAGVYRARAAALLGQGVGAVAGIGLGSLEGPLPAKVLVAAAIAFACGIIGAIGPVFTAASVMAVVGAAFAQFSGLAMPWWQQAVWYLVGTAAIALPALLPWLARSRRQEREAIARVLHAAAELLAAVGTEDAPRRRAELAICSADARAAVVGYRLTAPRGAAELLEEFADAQRVAMDAAAHYIAGTAAPRFEASEPDAFGPLRRRAAAGMHTVNPRAALLAGLRLAVCMAAATLAAGLLHHEGHSYWLPLTVAVVVRTEYGSIFARTVNRIVGSLGGALVAALTLLILHSGWPLVPVAALAIGFAVLAAPRSYAASVVGVTASALLSAGFVSADAVLPIVRLGDSVLGCAIALVFGYVLWPARGALPERARLAVVARLVVDYLRAACDPAVGASGLVTARADAYRVAHAGRAQIEAALAEPWPATPQAERALAAAVALEDAVDGISALNLAVQAGRAPLTTPELRRLEDAILACASTDADARTTATPAQLVRALLVPG